MACLCGACPHVKVKELANRGIRLEALLDFYDNLLKEEFGFHFKPLEHTTADVVIRPPHPAFY